MTKQQEARLYLNVLNAVRKALENPKGEATTTTLADEIFVHIKPLVEEQSKEYTRAYLLEIAKTLQ